MSIEGRVRMLESNESRSIYIQPHLLRMDISFGKQMHLIQRLCLFIERTRHLRSNTIHQVELLYV